MPYLEFGFTAGDIDDDTYALPDCVMRREDIKEMVEDTLGGLTAAVTVVTAVGVFNGLLKKKTQILTFTDGLLKAVSAETAWS